MLPPVHQGTILQLQGDGHIKTSVFNISDSILYPSREYLSNVIK